MDGIRQRIVGNETTSLEPVQLSIAQNQDEQPLSCCARMAYSIANCVKRLGVGIFWGGLTTGITAGMVLLSRKMNPIKATNTIGMERLFSMNMEGVFGFRLDNEALLKATCHLQEVATQMNQKLSISSVLHLTAFRLKAICFVGDVIIAPILEELIFRGLVQTVLLPRILEYLDRQNEGEEGSTPDLNMRRIVRIFITSGLFAYIHKINSGISPNGYVNAQMFQAFLTGIVQGILKETKVGLLGSIGAHMANNMMAITPVLFSC